MVFALKVVVHGIIFLGILSGSSWAQSINNIERARTKADQYYQQGLYDQALIEYVNGYRLASQYSHIQAANLAVDISSIYHMQGKFGEGASICHEGEAHLKRATAQPDSIWFKLNSSLGEMYKKLNNSDSCYLYFSRANGIIQQHPELEKRITEYVIYHYNNQGLMYVQEGRYSEGLSYMAKAISIAEKYTTSKEDIAILQNNLGAVYSQLGEFSKALVLRNLAAKNYSKNDIYKCKIFNGITEDAIQDKSFEIAKRYAIQAVQLSKTIQQPDAIQSLIRVRVLAQNALGRCALQDRQIVQAKAFFISALDQFKYHFGNKGSILSTSYLGLAQLAQKQNQLDKALQYCQQAIIASHNSFTSGQLETNPPATDAHTEQTLFDALLYKADLFVQYETVNGRLINLENACIAYERALDVADIIRKGNNGLETKWFFTNRVRHTYIRAFQTAYQFYIRTQKPADKERAFRILERSKAAVQADVTHETLIKPTNVPATLLARERELKRTITAKKLNLSAGSSPELINAQIQLSQLLQQFEKEYPAYYQAKYESITISSKAIQKGLDERMAYISYLLTDDALYVAVVTPENLQILQKKGEINQLRSALNTLFTSLYTNPGLGNYTGTSAAITSYQWLIEPISYWLNKSDRLIISQDSELHRLPFEVLETGRIIDDFLIKRYAISYVPSAITLLHRLKALPTKSTNSLLSMAPFVPPVGTKPSSIKLPYLPASQDEVEQLPGEALLGKAATKFRFMRNYADYDILHFATHAYADDHEPAHSFIAFYPDGSSDKLYAGEIYNLSLQNMRLTVLSACETGKGRLQAGEGIMSIAQAFAYAGCPAVVSTLWSANDESTAFLSRQLYTYLQQGMPIDIALQKTRLHYFQSDIYPKLNHPHYWANFVLIGSSNTIYKNTWSVSTILITTLCLLLGLGIFSWYRQRV